MPRVPLRSFHSVHHVEFYKPIPMGQSRCTHFEISNESYDHKHVRLTLKTQRSASIAVHPAAIDLRRGQCALIAVSCAPSQAMPIEEVVGIEWDSHCIQVHVHAVAFEKSLRSNLAQMRLPRAHRKRSLLSMKREANECSIQNSSQKVYSRRAVLSPTIRREKAFTAAPFSSPAPNRAKSSFQFSHAHAHNAEAAVCPTLSAVQEQEQEQEQEQQSMTPKEFKKRRMMVSNSVAMCSEMQQSFEKLCLSAEPLQALFRCYLARKHIQLELRATEYFTNVLKLQRITKRVRCKYLAYRDSCVVLQASIRGYTTRTCTQRQAHMQAEICVIWNTLQQRTNFFMLRSSCVTIQTIFRSYLARKQHRQRQRQAHKQQCMEMLLAFYRVHRFRACLQRRRRAIFSLQCWFRSMQQQALYRSQHGQLHDAQFARSVIQLQAMIRGKFVRLQCAQQHPQLQSRIAKVQRAHANWRRERTVNYSLQSALRKLAQSRSLYGVSEACDTLQALLRVVPNLSDRIVEHNVVGALYAVLRNSNRSVPHLTLVNKILDFLLFFGQYDRKCFAAIFHRNDTLDILSERLQIHRLDFVLFEKTTKLLFIGVDAAGVALAQNTFLLNLRNSDVHRQIRTVHNIMCTKLEIAKRVNKPLHREPNANEKYKMKFEQERVLLQCVQNMNALVEKL